MRTIEEIRRARLLQLLDAMTAKELAQAIGRSQAQVSQWKSQTTSSGRTYNIDSESARDIERLLGKPVGWMDNDPARDRKPRERRARDRESPSMGQTVAAWIDAAPRDVAYRAFWIIHQMFQADEWPEAPSGSAVTPEMLDADASSPSSKADPSSPPSARPTQADSR